MRSVITGLALIGVSLLLIWALHIDLEDGKFGAGLASIPGVIGAYLLWAPVRERLWGDD